MANVTREITVDVSRLNTFQAIIAKQGDYLSRNLKITLADNGTVIEADTGSIATLNVLRSDKTSNGFIGTVNEDGTVTVPLTAWMLALDGVLKCSLSVVLADQTRLTTTSFVINVEVVEYTGEGIEEDENYSILTSLLATSTAAITGANTAAASANEAAGDANGAATAANTAAALVTPTYITTFEGTSITIADNTFYTLTGITTLTLAEPSTSYASHLRLTMASSGTIAVVLDSGISFTGDDITNATAGEVWELSVIDGLAYVVNWGVPT